MKKLNYKRKHGSGKGDTYRSVNRTKYEKNFDSIDWDKVKKDLEKKHGWNVLKACVGICS